MSFISTRGGFRSACTGGIYNPCAWECLKFLRPPRGIMIKGLENFLGGLIGGTWANSYLYMIEIIMAVKYYSRFQDDPPWLKSVVILTLVVDSISTINNYICTYMYTVLHWGDRQYLQNEYWPFQVYIVTTGVSALIVQQFLTHRFWTLTKNSVITLYLFLASLTAFGGAIATATIMIRDSTFDSEREAVRIPVTIWLVVSAIADVSIAGVLIYTLHKHKSPFRQTKKLIEKLTTLAIQTGAPGSIVATIALFIYLSDPDGNISTALGFMLGRIYALTMLHNLNSRTRLRGLSREPVTVQLTTTTRDVATDSGAISGAGIPLAFRPAVDPVDDIELLDPSAEAAVPKVSKNSRSSQGFEDQGVATVT
ncbi:hypothetical protein PM082_023464 [Marasmius tenuissimus]|nr:hypothetical protein PM082_023464 [Marasmius tenuissimus]